ncbi:MAG: transglutaminase-like domain-containing protein [Planctomycetaceae bacterium]
MRCNPLILTMLTATGLLVYPYSAVCAQPPLIFPQPRLKSLQAPAIQPQRQDDSTEQDELSDLRDVWFLIDYEGVTIGYESLRTTEIDVSGGEIGKTDQSEILPMVRRSRETRLKLKRFEIDLSVSAHLETIETIDGVLHSWSLRRTAADGSTLQRSATWNAARQAFLIHSDPTDPKRTELLQSVVQPRSPILLAWLAAPELERPQQWSSAVLFPETAAIVDVEIRQMPAQSLRLKDGSTIAVTRHDYWPSNQPELRSSVYYDNELDVVLIEQPLLGRTLRFYRTDAATAFGEENLQSLDLQFLTALPLRRPLLNPERSNVVRMMISVGDSEQIFLPSSDFQAVEQQAANSLIVRLTRPVTSRDGAQPAISSQNTNRPDRRFTDSSRWINSKDDSIRRMAVIAGGAVTDPHEKCKRLTSYINSHLRPSSFSTSLRPASDVVKSREGDCTEYAVLLAALMRSEGVPARVAVGFAYVSNPASFVPHMWTEAWINGQWIPFDATLGGEVNPVTRLKVIDSALSDNVTSGTLLFIPLLNFLGRATVEILPDE